MRPTHRAWMIFIAVLLGLGAAAFVVWREETAVSLVCDPLEVANANHPQFAMQFAVTNKRRIAVSALELDISETAYGSMIGEQSHYTLRGPFPPGVHTGIVRYDVPRPPHYHAAHFSKLDCELTDVLVDAEKTR